MKALTLSHIEELENKIAALKEMRDTLAHLVHCCDGDHRPDCPIIKSLEGTVPLPGPTHGKGAGRHSHLKHAH